MTHAAATIPPLIIGLVIEEILTCWDSLPTHNSREPRERISDQGTDHDEDCRREHHPHEHRCALEAESVQDAASDWRLRAAGVQAELSVVRPHEESGCSTCDDPPRASP